MSYFLQKFIYGIVDVMTISQKLRVSSKLKKNKHDAEKLIAKT